MQDDGFLKQPRKFASGDDVDVGDRAASLLKLVGGVQEQARHESWKKRRFEAPHSGETVEPNKET